MLPLWAAPVIRVIICAPCRTVTTIIPAVRVAEQARIASDISEARERLLTKHFGEPSAIAYSVDDSGRSIKVVGMDAFGAPASEKRINEMFEHFTRYTPVIVVSGGRVAEPRKFQWNGKDFALTAVPA